jgi:hypothetical protein
VNIKIKFGTEDMKLLLDEDDCDIDDDDDDNDDDSFTENLNGRIIDVVEIVSLRFCDFGCISLEHRNSFPCFKSPEG